MQICSNRYCLPMVAFALPLSFSVVQVLQFPVVSVLLLGLFFFFGWLWPLHHPNTCRGGVCKKSHHLFQTTVSVPGVPLVGAGQYHFHWQPCLEALATVRDVAWKWFTYERIMEVGTGHRHCWHFHLGVSAARTVFDGGWLSKHTCSMRRCSVRLLI